MAFSINIFTLKGMVHLIYKLYLKAVFFLVKYKDAVSFSKKWLFLM